MNTVKPYTLKICGVCEAPFESSWTFCSNGCIEEGYKRAAKESKLITTIKDNIASQLIVLSGYEDLYDKHREMIAQKEIYGLSVGFEENILPIQRRQHLSQS